MEAREFQEYFLFFIISQPPCHHLLIVLNNHIDRMPEHITPVFDIDVITLPSGQELSLVATESGDDYSRQLPADWHRQVAERTEVSDAIFFEYFRPELARTTYVIPVLGRMAVYYSDRTLNVYDTLTETVAEQGKAVSVADVASNMAFMAYESALPNSLMYSITSRRGKGVAGMTPDLSERMLPSPTDARRMLTAAAIRQEAELLPGDAKLTYVAAPAHILRVKDYLTRPHDRLDRMRYATYQKAMPGLDRTVRTYEPRRSDDGVQWDLVSRRQIR